MKVNGFILLMFLYSYAAFGQVENVVEEIEDAYENYESAVKKIKAGIEYINQCYNSNTVDDIQSYSGYAESEISSAKRYVEYAEDEANDAEDEAANIDCSNAEDEASDAEDYFYSAKSKLNNAMSELWSASYEDDSANISSYLSNAKDYINQASRDLDYAVDDLNDALDALKNCTVNVANYSSSAVSCSEFFEYIKENGYQKSKISSYIMNSSFLKSVTAYTYDYKIYVVAEIKENEYSYKTNSYIFCDISDRNWSNFKNGGYGDSDSYGERFHKYIFDYKCNCE